MINFLEQLCLINGVSGDEGAVREVLIKTISPYCTEIKTDSMGNLIAYKNSGAEKTVALFAHMDEIGFRVTAITDKGNLKFAEAGGVDPQILPSQLVTVGSKNLNGVVGTKAVHLLSKEERNSKIKLSDLVIDIGAKDKADAQKHVSVGDFVAFNSEFVAFGDEFIKSKAIDNRAGCCIITNLLKENLPVNIIAVFTVQEELGLRGAKTAAFGIDPDMAIVVEATTASDVYGVKKENHVAVLGNGPVISFMDKVTVGNPRMVEFLRETAERADIPYQLKQGIFGGNDGGKIHLSKAGIKTVSISIPTRYIHSPVSVMTKSDFENTYKLLHEFLSREALAI